MQIVEIPRDEDLSVVQYEKPDRSIIDLVTTEDDVKVATLFEIHKETSLEVYVSKNNLIPTSPETGGAEAGAK